MNSDERPKPRRRNPALKYDLYEIDEEPLFICRMREPFIVDGIEYDPDKRHCVGQPMFWPKYN